MSRYHHTTRPVVHEDEADKEIARITGNPYHANLVFKRCRVDLSTVDVYEEGVLNTPDESRTNCVLVYFSNKPPITLMDTYDEFTKAFDKYLAEQEPGTINYNYQLNAVK